MSENIKKIQSGLNGIIRDKVKFDFIKDYAHILIFAHPVTSGWFGKFFDQFDTFVDITGFEKRKREILGKHACQVPYPERLDIEDIPRGKRCGVDAAELFYVYELSETRDGILTRELKKNFKEIVSDR